MPSCPVCGRRFRSSRGLLQHLRRSHPERMTRDPLEALGVEVRRLLGRTPDPMRLLGLGGGKRRARRRRRR